VIGEDIMYEYYEDEPSYYEPTIADEILIEYQQKMKDALLESIKLEIENIKKENIKLKDDNKEYKKRETDLLTKERNLKYKEENLKREVTSEFYKSNIGDTLKQYIEDSEVWFADIERYQKSKCNLCDEKRELIAKFPNGKTTKTECTCAKMLSKYIPALSELTVITFSKNNSNYLSDRKFYLSKTYSPPNNRSNYDYDYQEFRICHVVNEFNESIIALHENKRYSEKLGFRNKEECQKYCDWLNKNR
jgi:FtsZ-binding cell division protein ZapB